MNFNELQEFNKLEQNLDSVRQQGISVLSAYGVEMQSDDSIQDVVSSIQKIDCVKSVTVNDNIITVTQIDGTIEQYTVKDTTYSVAGNSLGLMKTGGNLNIVNGVGYVINYSHLHSIENVDELQEALDGKAASSHTHRKQDITDFPTSLPASDVSAWAKAATKPTYTAEEVGADESGAANTALSNAKSYTDTEIANLINGAPTTLDTLGEIATAMTENQSVVEALDTAIGTKANESDLTAHTGDKSNPHSVTKSQVGLGNVPNVATNDQTPTYSDTTTFATLTSGEKISVAFGKIKLAITNLINHIANKSNPHEVTKSQIGLGNVGNFKAVSTVAGQGLTESEKANARTNIGAGASSFSGDYNDLANKPTIPSAVTESTVSGWGFTKNTGTYSKPSGGIPKSDLASDVQTSLGKADTALQEHQSLADYVKTTDSRLSDARTPKAHTHTKSEITDFPTSLPANGGNAKTVNGHTVNSDVPSGAKFTDTVYTLPAATSSVLGGVKTGSNITNSSGTISLTKANVTAALGYTPPTTNTTYGVATSSALGLVKSGRDITVDSSGNVSVNDDSHNHVVSNIDGLQTTLDGKLNKSGGTMTGALVAQSNTDYTTAQVRNVIISADEPSGNAPDGTIWYQYE